MLPVLKPTSSPAGAEGALGLPAYSVRRIGLRCDGAERAWTLIEMIGTLALIAILAGVLLPVLVRHTDVIVAQQEVVTLKSFRDALQQYILATRVIPAVAPDSYQNTWYSAIAGKLGFGTNDVLYNVRQQSHAQPRVFLIDPFLAMGPPGAPVGLPYTQTNYYVGNSTVSTPMLPVNPRVMIVSSLGQALPKTVVSGVFGSKSDTYFSDLWNAPDRTVPADDVWNGWPGSPEDVIVQRINLGPLFVHLLLSRYNAIGGGWYTIDGISGATVPQQVTRGVDGYFIQGTVLTLYTNSVVAAAQPQAMDTWMILNEDSSFVFEQGIWRGTLTGASLGNGAAGSGDVVQAFLNATPSTNSMFPYTNFQQILVVSNMISYMSNYNYWAYTNGFKDNTIKTYIQNLEANSLMPSVLGLYSLNPPTGAPAGCCYPTNGTAINCQ